MANKKISQLNAVTTLSNNDVFPVVQGTETKKAKISDIKSYLPTASSLLTGLLSNTDWVTFNNKQNALTLGNLTESTSSVLTITGGTGSIIGSGLTIQVKQASGSQNGFLSSTDWTTFNSKMSSLTLTTTGTSGAATLVGSTLNIPQYLGTAVTSLGGQTGATQTFSTDTTGTDFAITSATNNHKFSIPNASATARGLLTSSNWTDFNSKEPAVTWGDFQEQTSSVLTITGGTGAVRGGIGITVKQVGASQDGYLSKGDYSTFVAKQNAITLTTTGSSGAATLINDVLNIPQYASGITSLNTLTSSTQTFATGSSGSDFNISSSTSTHTFNIPTASASNRGLLSTTDWSTFNGKQGALTLTTTGTSGAATLVGNTLNIPQYSGGGGGGISTLNTLTASTQTFATGTSGSDFNISSSTSTHTFNIPDAGASARGVVTTGTQTLAGSKTFSSAPTFSTMTAGSILFAGTSGLVSQKNANLFWDNTNNRIGINTSSPSVTVDVRYDNNAFARGLTVRNTNTGTQVIHGIQILDATGTGRGNFDFYPSNFTNAANANSVAFCSDRANKLAFIANSGAIGGAQDITFSTLGTNTTYNMQIKANGNVQIATNTDGGYKFDVNGTTRTQGDFTISDTRNIILGTSTGNKIGTATSQKIGFWNATPVIQPTTSGASAVFVSNAGTTITSTDTFDGYTIAQVVKALRNIGILA